MSLPSRVQSKEKTFQLQTSFSTIHGLLQDFFNLTPNGLCASCAWVVTSLTRLQRWNALLDKLLILLFLQPSTHEAGLSGGLLSFVFWALGARITADPDPAAHVLYWNLQEKNAYGHVRRTILCEHLQEKCRSRIPGPAFCVEIYRKKRTRTLHKRHVVLKFTGKSRTPRRTLRLNTGS